MNLNEIYKRVSVWNGRRYDRVHDLSLTCRLLREEKDERFDSDEEVHQLDALCDTIYVALGGIWKADISDTQMNYDLSLAHTMSTDLLRANVIKPGFFVSAFIDAIEHDTEFPVSLGLQCIVNMCLLEMQYMGLNLDQCYRALLVVCDSNDTKSIPKDKVDPSVKANQDKGQLFIAPEPRLQKILDERHG